MGSLYRIPVLSAVLLLAGCAAEPQLPAADVRITAVLGADPASRAQIDDTHTLCWKSEDRLGLVPLTGEGEIRSSVLAFHLTEGAGTKRGIFSGPEPDAGQNYLAMHLNRGRMYVEEGYLHCALYDAAGHIVLSASGAGSAEDYLLMSAGSVSGNRIISSELVFTHQCTFFEFLLTGAAATKGKSLSEVTLAVPDPDFLLTAAYDAEGMLTPEMSRYAAVLCVEPAGFPPFREGETVRLIVPVLWNPDARPAADDVMSISFRFSDGASYRLEKPIREFLPGIYYRTEFAPGAPWGGSLVQPASINPAAKQLRIGSAEELAWLANEVSVYSSAYGRFEGWEISLIRDIDLGGECIWQPIGQGAIDTSDKRFRGVFDGAGYTVSGLRIETSAAQQALFCFLDYPGVIRNLTVRGTVHGGPQSAGICAYNSGGLIENCVNEVEVVSDKQYVGGVCATNASSGTADEYHYGRIKGCINRGCIAAVNGNVGGIVGSNAGGIIAGCRNEGHVSSPSAGGIGGIVGQNVPGSGSSSYAAATTAVVSASLHVTGNVSSPHAVKGFIAGRNQAGQVIENSYFHATDRSFPQNAVAVTGVNPTGAILTNSGALSRTLWPEPADAGWGATPPANWVGPWRTPWGQLGSWNNGKPLLPKLDTE